MALWRDYDLDNPSSWEVMPAPPIDPSFTEGLTRLAGLNPFGKPMLRCVWGGTQRDEMAVDNGLKYFIGRKDRTLEGFVFTCPVTGMELMVAKMEDVPAAVVVAVPKYSEPVDLGERRWMIEIWRSQEFLTRSGRYTEATAYDNGGSTDYVFCRRCDTELAQNEEPPPCPNCGYTQYYIRTERDEGEGQLLRIGAPEGAYDCFLRLENALGEPMAADARALRLIEVGWNKLQNQSRTDKMKELALETEGQMVTNQRATSPTNPFQAPAVAG